VAEIDLFLRRSHLCFAVVEKLKIAFESPVTMSYGAFFVSYLTRFSLRKIVKKNETPSWK
jgi:hypothetical protein